MRGFVSRVHQGAKSYRKFNALDESPFYLLLPRNLRIGWVNSLRSNAILVRTKLRYFHLLNWRDFFGLNCAFPHCNLKCRTILFLRIIPLMSPRRILSSRKWRHFEAPFLSLCLSPSLVVSSFWAGLAEILCGNGLGPKYLLLLSTSVT